MNIAIDISPLKTGHFEKHRVRGTGFYLENLKQSLLEYFPKHSYRFFTSTKELGRDVDLVHIPYFEPFFITIPLRKKLPTVITVHDLTPLVFPRYFPAGFRGKVKWQTQRLSLKRMDAIITDSESSKKDIIRFVGYPENNIHVIYLAADRRFKPIKHASFLDQIKKRYKLPSRFVLYVGDATWNKNLSGLVAAVKKIDVPLVMVGKALVDNMIDSRNVWNQDLVAVQNQASENKQIMRLGFVPSDDLVALYNLATLFVMPSFYEGFGLPLLEAMASGCPVLTSAVGSVPEVVGEAAYFVNPKDSQSIAQGINRLLANEKQREEFKQKGLKQAKKFSWQKTAQETIKVYEDIVSYTTRL